MDNLTYTCGDCGGTFVDPLHIYPGPAWCPSCNEKRKKRERANAARRARHQVYTDLGMKRVKGNLGGTYYE